MGEDRRIFFPGCSLTAYSPDLVARTYEYLNDILPGTGIMLGCCGDRIKKAGHGIIEIPHSKNESHCCGMGGMVYVADAELGRLKSRRTLDEANKDVVTYCATCRGTL